MSNVSTTDTNLGNGPLNEQVDKLKSLLFTKDTVTTLGQSINLVITLVKETLILGWLALCWTIVAIGWLGKTGLQTGEYLKQKLINLQESYQDRSPSDIATETRKTVMSSGKTIAEQILTGAKKQVGLLDE
jgi:hypothetical protein